MTEELNGISRETQFNKQRLLDGSASVVWSAVNGDRTFGQGVFAARDEFGQTVVTERKFHDQSFLMDVGVAQVQNEYFPHLERWT